MFDPWVGKMPWRREWQHTRVFLPGESHGQRSLASNSPWDFEESDTTKQLNSTTVEFSIIRQDFSVDPVAKSPHSQCRGPRFNSCSGN